MSGRNSVRIGRARGWLQLSRGQVGRGDLGGDAVWSLDAELHLDGVAAETSVWLGPQRAEQSLADFFADLAASADGWEGRRIWDGMEGGMTLTCAHDKLGTVSIEAELRHLSGASWSVRGVVLVDAGQLERLASDMRDVLTV